MSDVPFPRFSYNPNRCQSYFEGHEFVNGKHDVDRLARLAQDMHERKGSLADADYFENALRMLQYAKRFGVQGEALRDLSPDQRQLVSDALPVMLANKLPLLRETLAAWGLPPDGLLLECVHG
jgi:hypothetical protein